VEEPQNAFKVYFDSLLKVPREVKNLEIIFCFQSEGRVLSDPKPRIIHMKNITPDFEEPMKTRIGLIENVYCEGLDPPVNMIVEVRTSDP